MLGGNGLEGVAGACELGRDVIRHAHSALTLDKGKASKQKKQQKKSTLSVHQQEEYRHLYFPMTLCTTCNRNLENVSVLSSILKHQYVSSATMMNQRGHNSISYFCRSKLGYQG